MFLCAAVTRDHTRTVSQVYKTVLVSSVQMHLCIFVMETEIKKDGCSTVGVETIASSAHINRATRLKTCAGLGCWLATLLCKGVKPSAPCLVRSNLRPFARSRIARTKCLDSCQCGGRPVVGGKPMTGDSLGCSDPGYGYVGLGDSSIGRGCQVG